MESKNNHVVRKHAFYWRYDTAAELELLDRLWRLVSLRLNYFTPTRKAVGYTATADGRRKRIYDKPKTPWQRVQASGVLDETERSTMAAQVKGINPADLTRQINAVQMQLLDLGPGQDRGARRSPACRSGSIASRQSTDWPRRSGVGPHALTPGRVCSTSRACSQAATSWLMNSLPAVRIEDHHGEREPLLQLLDAGQGPLGGVVADRAVLGPSGHDVGHRQRAGELADQGRPAVRQGVGLDHTRLVLRLVGAGPNAARVPYQRRRFRCRDAL